MTEHRNPDQLSSDLDRFFPADNSALPSSLPDDTLLNAAAYLAAAPKPVLTADARARMKAKMLAAIPAVPATAPAAPATPPNIIRPVFRYFITASAAAAILAVTVFGLMSVMRNNRGSLTPTAPAVANLSSETPTVEATDEPTSEPTSEATVEPTAQPTVEPTDESQDSPTTVPTDEPTVAPTTEPTEEPTVFIIATEGSMSSTDEPTDEPTIEPAKATSEPSVTPSPTELPSATPTETPALVAKLTIEGKVDAITEQQLTISGFEIALAEDHPLLEYLKVGDYLRLSGEIAPGRGQGTSQARGRIVIEDVAQFEIAAEDGGEAIVEAGPDGEVWRDSGTCENPPPDWANANGWRARCVAGNQPGGGAVHETIRGARWASRDRSRGCGRK